MDSRQLAGLIRKAQAGNREALDQMLRNLQDRLRVAAEARLRRVGQWKLRPSDVLQSTYMHVIRSIGRFQGDNEEVFVAWVTQIMENCIRDQLKYQGRAKRRHPTGQKVVDAALEAPDLEGTPSGKVGRVEDLVVVGQALDRLKEEQRQVILLRIVEEREYAEIAELLGKSEGAVRMMLSRARANLALEMDRLLDED